MRHKYLFSRLVFGLALVMLFQSAWAVDTPANKAYLVEIDGTIGPVTQELITTGPTRGPLFALPNVLLAIG